MEEQIIHRFERLEREWLWWKAIAICLAAVLVLLALWGAAALDNPREIRAKGFFLVDENGDVRAEFSVKQGKASLEFKGHRVPGFRLESDQKSSSLVFWGEDGATLLLNPSLGIILEGPNLFKHTAEISLNLQRGLMISDVSMRDSAREGQSFATLDSNNLMVSGPNGHAMLSYGTELSFWGKSPDRIRASLGLERNGHPRLIFFGCDQPGQIIWQAPR